MSESQWSVLRSRHMDGQTRAGERASQRFRSSVHLVFIDFSSSCSNHHACIYIYDALPFGLMSNVRLSYCGFPRTKFQLGLLRLDTTPFFLSGVESCLCLSEAFRLYDELLHFPSIFESVGCLRP
jgi:hypothetical protein